jgi:HemY protein
MEQDPGYILIAYHHTTLEMTLWFGVFALILSWALVRFIAFIFSSMIDFPNQLKLKKANHASSKAQALRQDALVACVNGQFSKATSDFKKLENHHQHSIIDYLGSAFALHKENNIEACQIILKKALEQMPEQASTIHFMQAQLSLTQGRYENALDALQALPKHQQSQDFYLLLMMRCYMGLSEWKNAYALYAKFSKIVCIEPCEKNSMYQTIIIGCLGSLSTHDLPDFWSSLQKNERRQESYVWLLADRFIENNEWEQATDAIFQLLKNEFHEDVWELLTTCVPHQTQFITKFCQKQLRLHPNQWIIAYCAGLCSQEAGNFNQAEIFFKQSIAIKPTEQALFLLADIYHQQGLVNDFHQTCLQILAHHPREESQ